MTGSWRLWGWALLVPFTFGIVSWLGHEAFPPARFAWLAAVTAASLASVVLYRSTRVYDRASDWLSRHTGAGLAVLVVGYAIYSAARSGSALAAYSSDLHQLGLFAQSEWTTLHGHLLANTHESTDGTLVSHFGVHFSPALLPMALLYALWQSPLLLMAIQGLCVALAVVPLYHLLRVDAPRAPAFLLAGAVLLLPSLGRAGWLDFHDATFLPALLLTAAFALRTRRPWLFLGSAVAALGFREDTGLTLAALGAWALCARLGWKPAAGAMILGLAWLVFAVRFVMPHFAAPGLWIDPGRFFALHLGTWGDSPRAALASILSHPSAFVSEMLHGGRLQYMRRLLQPMLLVPPFLDPISLVGLPALAASVASRQEWMRLPWKYHALVPAVFAYTASALAAARAAGPSTDPRRAARGIALAVIVLAGLLAAQFDTPPTPHRASPPPAAAARMVAGIPAGVPVYAHVSLYPALANREFVGSWDALGARALEPAVRRRYEWLVLWPGGDPPGEPRDAALSAVLAADSGYSRVAAPEPFVVFRKRR